MWSKDIVLNVTVAFNGTPQRKGKDVFLNLGGQSLVSTMNLGKNLLHL